MPALVNNTATTTYTFTPSAGLCATTTTMTITVNPNLSPVISCGTSTVSSVSFDWANVVGASSYNVTYTINGAGSTNSSSTSSDFSVTGLSINDLVDITVTPIGTGCYVSSTGSCSALGCTPPTITTQPLNDVNCVGTSINLSISENGGSTYQWQISTDGGTIFSNLTNNAVYSNVTTTTLIINDNTGLNGNMYRVVVNEINNLCPTTSTFSTLTVNPILIPTITCGISTAASVTFNWNSLVGVTDYDITYRINGGTIQNGGNILINTFAVTGLTAGDIVDITVTPNGTGCFTDGSGTCTAINCTPPTINTQAVDDINCEGNPITFTVTETGGTSYQWQISTDNGITFTNLLDGGIYSGATTATLDISDNTGLNANQYQLIIDESTGFCPTTSNIVTVTANQNITPTFNTITAICSGGILNALPLNSTNAISGTWSPALDNTATTTYTFAPDANQCAVSNTLEITVNPIITPTFATVNPICSGEVLAALPLNSLNSIGGTWSPALDNLATTIYTFTPTAGLCAATNTLTVTVNPFETPAITCGASTVSSVTFDWTALTGVASYSISYSINGGVNIAAANQIGVSFTVNGLSPNDVVDISITPNGTGCYLVGTATCTALNCNAPIITTQPISNVACEGNPVTFTSVVTGGSTFQWQASNDNGTTFFNLIDVVGVISGSSTNTLNISDNTGLNGLIYRLIINEINNTCPTTSVQVSLTANPIPVITATNNGPLCEGSQLDISATNFPGAIYTWTGPAFASGIQNNSIPQVFVANAGDYTVTALLNGCSASSTTTVVINTQTPVTILPAGPFCESDPSVILTADVLGGIWSGSGITDPNLGIFSPSNAQSGLNAITYILSAGCGGLAQSAIQVNANPIASFTLNTGILDPINPSVTTFNLSKNAATYLWSFGNNSISTDFEPTYLYPSDIRSYTISLIATSIDGCVDSTSAIVTVPETLIFYVPNAFTPNQDELNNTFFPVFTSGYNPFEYHLSIFNRWGERIFESFDPQIGWDGTYKELGLVETGTYVWKIDFGLTINGEKKSVLGSVSIIK